MKISCIGLLTALYVLSLPATINGRTSTETATSRRTAPDHIHAKSTGLRGITTPTKNVEQRALGKKSSSKKGSSSSESKTSKSLKSKSKKGKKGCSNVGPLEPPLAGVLPGVERPKIILAQDVDYPPYAQLGLAEDDFPISGFGPDFATGMMEVCDIDVVLVQTQWSRCWTNDRIGEGLALGEFHGCTTYSHAAGVRNRYLEFSRPILDNNKAAGILTRLDAGGNPVVDGTSNLDGIRIVDVVGFAPTKDNLAIVTNNCTGERFSGYEIVDPPTESDFPNDDALRALLDGTADAMWVYADQVERFQCANNEQPTPWDCSLWDTLGTDIAYIHTGMFEWARAGTTLTIAKKGAGLADIVNPCIEAFLATESYYDLCEEYEFTTECYPNAYFPADAIPTETPVYDIPTSQLTTDCSSGYCSCPLA